VDSSEQRLASTLPANNDAPSSSASSTLTLLKLQNVGSEITVCWCAIIPHFLLFRHRPVAFLSAIIVCMSTITMSTEPPRVMSSKHPSVQLSPDTGKALLQVIDVPYRCLVDAFLYQPPDQGCSPKKEVGGRLKQDLDKDF